MSKYSIEENSLTAIANAVRELRQENDMLTPAEIAEKINDSDLSESGDIDLTDHYSPVTNKWIRPEEYPNLDAIDIPSDFDGVYLTYDLRKTSGYGWIGIRIMASSSLTAYFDRGHLENGTFVVDESFSASGSLSNGATFIKDLDEEDGLIQLWRITSNKSITRFWFCSKSATNAQSIAAKIQPCVEATGQLLAVTQVQSDSLDYRANYYSYATVWMEKDSRAVKSPALTSLSGAWNQAYRLQEIDFSKWDTSSAVVTSLYNTWNSCYSLRRLDLNPLVTSSWRVTNLQNAFYSCFSLKSINFEGWDTSKWDVTTIASAWYQCFSLESLDLSAFDTSNWAVNNFASCWAYCRRLIRLDISSWDTSKWTVANLSDVFRECLSLLEIPVDNWDTGNWVVTSMSSTFNNCHNIKKLGIGKWDVSSWQVTSLNATFSSCYSLEELDLSDWNTENWAVTTLNETFYSCRSLKRIDLRNWDTSNWAVTTVRSLFGNSTSLMEIDVTGWDTSGFNLVSNALGYTFVDLYNLRSCKGFETWECFSTVTSSGNVPIGVKLTDFTGMPLVYNCDFSSAHSLTKESLIAILTVLPELTGTHKITLGQTNKLKLTPEEIAIATDKGWTVA